ncbi:MAG TPA: hypothetical protein VHQ64_00295 [Pyrinomonadaceae bacterium]|jgi:hypothetical protein|nr:hypothetical protein [Pyrinomonadaceae bacterium]
MNHRRTLSVLLGVLFAASAAAAQTLLPFNHARNVNPDVQGGWTPQLSRMPSP